MLFLAFVVLAGCGTDPDEAPNPPPVPPTTATNEFSTYLGSDLADAVRDLALDSGGNLYVVGGARSADLLPGPPLVAFAGDEDAFVAKLTATGSVVWWTFLGGPGPDRAYAVAFDGQDLVVGGGAAAGFLPVTLTPGAALPTFQGGTSTASDPARDGFVAKLDGASGALEWATYFGGTDAQTSVVRDVAADTLTGDIYLVSSVQSPPTPSTAGDYLPDNFPQVILDALQNGYLSLRPGDQAPTATDGVLAKLTSDGTQLPWATYVGGTSTESAEGSVRLDSQGRPVVLFDTFSTQRVVTPAVLADTRPDPDIVGVSPVLGPMTIDALPSTVYDAVANGGTDFFIAKYEANGTPIFATFVGGNDNDTMDSNNLALRADGRVVVAATTSSSSFPVPELTAYDPFINGSAGALPYSGDCVVFVLEDDGSALLGATYYGGGNGDGCSAVGVDGNNHIYVAGGTRSTNLPTANGAFQTTLPAPLSAFMAVFSADLGDILFGSYFGGSGGANANALVVRDYEHFSFGGEAGSGYPLPATPPPARGTVSATALHGAVSDVTVQP